MRINHHNYEEYFILYMDNELNAEDRRMVEAFVQQYPELNDELQLLSQYKLEPDTAVIFNGKEELMKIDGETPVSLANYEEWIVLYHDNELSETQRSSLELFLLGNPALKKEFEQLKRVKLEPQQIIFTDKASLYRKEEKTRPLPWFRIAAAAILLLAISVTAIFILNNTGKKQAGDELVKDNPPVIKTTETKIVDPVAVVNPGLSTKETNTVTSEKEKPVSPVTISPSYVKQNNTPGKNNSSEKIAVQTAVKNEPSNNLPQPEEQTLVAVRKSNNLPESFKSPNMSNTSRVNNDIANHITPGIIFTKTIVTTPDPEPSDIDDGKNKNRGLFRKIARTFEKRAGMDPTEDDRLLVAGLSIKLK